MSDSEARIQEKVQRALRDEGCFVVRVSHATVAGTPDLLVCYQGRFFAFEVKTPTGRIRPDQRVQNKLIEDAGGEGFIVRSAAEAVACLKSATSGRYEV